jgi:hypothetical protein
VRKYIHPAEREFHYLALHVSGLFLGISFHKGTGVALVLCPGVDRALMETRKLIREHAGHTVVVAMGECEIAAACEKHPFNIAVIGQFEHPLPIGIIGLPFAL